MVDGRSMIPCQLAEHSGSSVGLHVQISGVLGSASSPTASLYWPLAGPCNTQLTSSITRCIAYSPLHSPAPLAPCAAA